MDLNNLDWAHLAKVAFAGAVTAVVADVIHSQYGDEFAGILNEVQTLIREVLANNGPTQPTV